MKKFVNSQTNQLLNLGDTVVKTVTRKLPFGGSVIERTSYRITKEAIPHLLSQGIIKEVDEYPIKGIDWAIKELSEFYQEENHKNVINFLKYHAKRFPGAVYSMLTKLYSEDLSKKHKWIPKVGEKIYGISVTGHKVFCDKLDVSEAENYFSWFKTAEEASKVESIVTPYVKWLIDAKID